VTYVDSEGVDATGASITVQRRDSDAADSLYLLTNPEQMFTRFDGVTVQLQKRMSNNWQATASFVWGKATGRLGSSLRSPIQEPEARARNFGQNPNDYVNTDGRLIGDRPISAKLQLVYQLPAGFLVGANYNYQQGRPWARQAVLPSELTGGLSTTILAERIDGSRRVGSWSLLDLRVQKDFKLGSTARFALLADGMNVFNNDANDGIGSRVGTSDGFGVPTDFVLPRRLMLGAKLTF
jgi:hypothetical protein